MLVKNLENVLLGCLGLGLWSELTGLFPRQIGQWTCLNISLTFHSINQQVVILSLDPKNNECVAALLLELETQRRAEQQERDAPDAKRRTDLDRREADDRVALLAAQLAMLTVASLPAPSEVVSPFLGGWLGVDIHPSLHRRSDRGLRQLRFQLEGKIGPQG